MSILNEVSEYWGWVGIVPEEVIAENEFGNLIVKAMKKQSPIKASQHCHKNVAGAPQMSLAPGGLLRCHVSIGKVMDFERVIQN
ncbi:MAG: hypothetical protein HRT35_07080 [Algicola sp.]|nr:hypothetical protein [Algicola sp.]